MNRPPSDRHDGPETLSTQTNTYPVRYCRKRVRTAGSPSGCCGSTMRIMAVGALVRCHVSAETKTFLLARTSTTASPTSGRSDDAELRDERMSIRLAPDDRLMLQGLPAQDDPVRVT